MPNCGGDRRLKTFKTIGAPLAQELKREQFHPENVE